MFKTTGPSDPRWAAGRGGVELVQQLLKAKARSELMANRGSDGWRDEAGSLRRQLNCLLFR